MTTQRIAPRWIEFLSQHFLNQTGDVLLRVIQRFYSRNSLFSKYHPVLRYKPKCHFIYACNYDPRLANFQGTRRYSTRFVKDSLTEFPENPTVLDQVMDGRKKVIFTYGVKISLRKECITKRESGN